jgi:hypothetical protein
MHRGGGVDLQDRIPAQSLIALGRRVLHSMQEHIKGRALLFAYVQRLPQTNSHFLQAMNAATHF